MAECIQRPPENEPALVVRGARQHNLKNVDVAIPKNQLVVFTGVSGSGKSSLAFDTIFAEGQRRYVESLSSYARQFLGQMDKPDVDSIDGLTPAIAIDQKTTSNNPRSTVGTVTEIYDYLRVLYARAGRPHCPLCHRAIKQFTVQEIVDRLLALPEGTRLVMLAPQPKTMADGLRSLVDTARKAGYVRLRIGGNVVGIDDAGSLNSAGEQVVEVVVDRLVVRSGDEALEQRSRIADSAEQALKLGAGTVRVGLDSQNDLVFTENFSCPEHGKVSLRMEPRVFSFNSPEGACPECDGLGAHRMFDPNLVMPRFDRSIKAGAIAPWHHLGFRDSYYGSLLLSAAQILGIDPDQPLSATSDEQRGWLLWGRNHERVTVRLRDREVHVPWDGVIPSLERFYRERANDTARAGLEPYMGSETCTVCLGARLRPEVLAVTVAGANIADVTAMTVSDARQWFRDLSAHRYPHEPLTEREQAIARRPLDEVLSRLDFLDAVGLHYLTLERGAGSLSGGESQRIRLATQIGSSLSGVLYILDEPSIGLHPRDTDRLIGILHSLRDLGNSVLVVEHDEAILRAADYLIDLGPGAGSEGGRLIAAGPLRAILSCGSSVTGRYLSGRSSIPVPRTRRPFGPNVVRLTGAREHNLRNLTIEAPLGCLVAVVGVSGSGKSTIVEEILYPALARRLSKSSAREGKYDDLHGFETLAGVVDVNQSPLGRSPRSNPATYVGAFSSIRELLASTPEARIRGYRPGRFSFNVKGGRCEACEGDGVVRIEMQFLPDVFVPCSICQGRRYNREALEIHYKGQSIADVLDMTIRDALYFFSAVPALQLRLSALDAIGLGYMRLGQSATTLSGGEAQRVKLAAELARRARGKTLYLLDEPTTGLHPADVSRLLLVLGRLVDAGHTVVVIEHNIDVIKCADWILELGPGGGVDGGDLVAVGPPETVAANPASVIAPFLRRVLDVPAEI